MKQRLLNKYQETPNLSHGGESESVPQDARTRYTARMGTAARGMAQQLPGRSAGHADEGASHGAAAATPMRTPTCRGAGESTSIALAALSSKSTTRHGDWESPHGVSGRRSERRYGGR